MNLSTIKRTSVLKILISERKKNAYIYIIDHFFPAQKEFFKDILYWTSKSFWTAFKSFKTPTDHELRGPGVTSVTCATKSNTIQICKILFPRCGSILPLGVMIWNDQNLNDIEMFFQISFNWFLVKRFLKIFPIYYHVTLWPPPLTFVALRTPGGHDIAYWFLRKNVSKVSLFSYYAYYSINMWVRMLKSNIY